MQKRCVFRVVFFYVLLFTALLFISAQGQTKGERESRRIREFSFVHVTDTHVSPFYSMPQKLARLRSYACVRTIKDLGRVLLQPYNVTAPKPSFIIHTGDIAEYGFPGVTWQLIEKYFAGVKVPIYYITGNHDNTWVCNTEIFRRLYGGLNYSFDYGGCHFIGLCSATLQEPVPSFGEEVILFLKEDIEKVAPKTPVFVFFHHPLKGRAFCSRYDVDRVIDALRGHNVVLIMDGHGHNVLTHDYWGLDGVEGGSTFAKKSPPGFDIVYIRDNDLYVAYKKCAETSATKALLHKKILPEVPYPRITIHSPVENETIKGETLLLETNISGQKAPISRISYCLDDEITGEMNPFPRRTSRSISTSELVSGAHFLRVAYETKSGKQYSKSTTFFLEHPGRNNMGKAKWRFRMKGASKATPLVYKGTVYVGASDGILYALDEETGSLKWSFDAGAEILTSAAAWKDLLLFGAGNGRFFALTTAGKVKWSYDAKSAIYSSPRLDKEGSVYFGTNEAKVIALDAATGRHRWTNQDARYSVESQPFATKDRVFFGAWDGYLYCVDKKDGKTVWKKPGPKNNKRKRISRYYAPADNGPVITSGKVFIADRGYIAGEYTLDGAFVKEISSGCSAIGLSEDKKSLYLRCLKTPVKKISADGKSLWESNVIAGRIPVSPLEADEILYVCTNSGRLYALAASTGEVKWEYQVTPRLYVMSGVSVRKGVVFTTGTDGYVTAIAQCKM